MSRGVVLEATIASENTGIHYQNSSVDAGLSHVGAVFRLPRLELGSWRLKSPSLTSGCSCGGRGDAEVWARDAPKARQRWTRAVALIEQRAVDDGGHGRVDMESEIWLRRLNRRPGRAPLGGPPPSQSRPRREGEEGWFSPPLRSHSFLQGGQRSSDPLAAAGGPLRCDEATEGGGGQGRGGEHKLPSTTAKGGRRAPLYQVDWSTIDPGPVTRVN
ncbi:hypothetical protein Sjap_009802 [Stephania japonica]|uniref:Uncharacterized protein n=1 Tax=Stephania japonica TaxID=461633 RepID=A0AAP0J9Z6_9MAGN